MKCSDFILCPEIQVFDEFELFILLNENGEHTFKFYCSSYGCG